MLCLPTFQSQPLPLQLNKSLLQPCFQNSKGSFMKHFILSIEIKKNPVQEIGPVIIFWRARSVSLRRGCAGRPCYGSVFIPYIDKYQRRARNSVQRKPVHYAPGLPKANPRELARSTKSRAPCGVPSDHQICRRQISEG